MRFRHRQVHCVTVAASLLAGIAALMAGGCGSTPPGAPLALPATPARPPAPVVGDPSLPDDGYLTLGLPSAERAWGGTEMTTASTRLQSLAAEHPEQLPRFQSPRSGHTFARIVAADNLAFFRQTTVPLSSRLPAVIEFMDSFNAIFKLYLQAFKAHLAPSAELIELAGAQLRLCQTSTELTDEFVATLSRDDPRYEVRMAGLEQMRQGLAEVVDGVLTTLTEVDVYPRAERLTLLGYCRATLPSIVPKLAPGSQVEVLERLDALAADPRLADLHQSIGALRDQVRSASWARGAS
jgi:hypothetical protein